LSDFKWISIALLISELSDPFNILLGKIAIDEINEAKSPHPRIIYPRIRSTAIFEDKLRVSCPKSELGVTIRILRRSLLW